MKAELQALVETQIKYMVDRFLCWKLPENFNPDGGISFKKMRNKGTQYAAKNDPIGTNLLDAEQAEAMVRHMVEGLPGEALLAAQGARQSDEHYDEWTGVSVPPVQGAGTGMPTTAPIGHPFSDREKIKELQDQLRDKRTQFKQLSAEMAEITSKLKPICDHKNVKEYRWEHDNGYGVQREMIGKRCIDCMFVDLWRNNRFVDPANIYD